jgi:hypothetical protein
MIFHYDGLWISLSLSIAFWKSSAKGERKNNRSARGYDDSDL